MAPISAVSKVCWGAGSLEAIRDMVALPWSAQLGADHILNQVRPGSKTDSSHHLMHVDHHAVRVACGRRHENVLHEPAVVLVSGLEFRHGAAVDQLRVDRLAALELLQQLDRTEAHALVLDIDGRTVIGLEGVFGLQVYQLVGADGLEVGAEWQHLAGDRTLHLAADDRNDAANADAGLAGGDDVADLRGDGEYVFGFEGGGHRFTSQYAIIRVGSHVASSGNAIRITSRTRSVATNGITPLKMVENETSFTTLLMTKTFMPTGGWIRPSSTVITMMTPNQIGSNPRCVMTGKMIGTVRMIIAMASIRQPSTRYIIMISASTP